MKEYLPRGWRAGAARARRPRARRTRARGAAGRPRWSCRARARGWSAAARRCAATAPRARWTPRRARTALCSLFGSVGHTAPRHLVTSAPRRRDRAAPDGNKITNRSLPAAECLPVVFASDWYVLATSGRRFLGVCTCTTRSARTWEETLPVQQLHRAGKLVCGTFTITQWTKLYEPHLSLWTFCTGRIVKRRNSVRTGARIDLWFPSSIDRGPRSGSKNSHSPFLPACLPCVLACEYFAGTVRND